MTEPVEPFLELGLAPRQAELDVVMETRGKAHVDQILASLQGAGFPAQAL